MIRIDEKNELVQDIEYLREEMIRFGINEGFESENTLVLSQILDEYIIKYQTSI
ncbi:Spo0E family sporulation regulatory protein-aspartic acid phosphatase [Neobacillus drentensis]|uniref:Spo0E family sporulation regulatory protein-aspartic acid phosphatase n=1 Tax=Neobacillus drentensis TaxID=220684 RepID=UPI003B5882C1